MVAEAGVTKDYEDLLGSIRIHICKEPDTQNICDSNYEVELYASRDNGETLNLETDEISLHNIQRIKEWVCSTDLCKLVVSAEVDLTGWLLDSGDVLKATVDVKVDGDPVNGSDIGFFEVR